MDKIDDLAGKPVKLGRMPTTPSEAAEMVFMELQLKGGSLQAFVALGVLLSEARARSCRDWDE